MIPLLDRLRAVADQLDALEQPALAAEVRSVAHDAGKMERTCDEIVQNAMEEDFLDRLRRSALRRAITQGDVVVHPRAMRMAVADEMFSWSGEVGA